MTYCAQESSCRSEDVRLVHEYGKGWRAYYVDDAEFEGQNMISEGTDFALARRSVRRAAFTMSSGTGHREAQAAGVRAEDARGGREGAAVLAVVS